MGDPTGTIAIRVIILLILTFVNGFFSMCEIAVISANSMKMKKLSDEGNKKASSILRITENPSDFFATIQVGVTLAGLLSSAVAADSFNELLIDKLSFIPLSRDVLSGISLVVITLILSYFTLVLGELLPKRLAMRYADKLALGVSGIIAMTYKIMKPFVVLLSATTNGLLKLLGISANEEEAEVTEEDILMMVENSVDVIESGGQNMIRNIFDFEDKNVDEIMTHRTDIAAVSADTTISEFIAYAAEEGYSRIPVYKNNIDDIVGIVYVKDLLTIAGPLAQSSLALMKFARIPIYIPESMECSKLLVMLQEKKTHIAIVIDEHGGTSGMVTMEDLLEIIVGQIQDEYDDEEQEIKRISPTAVVFDGNVTIEEVETVLGADLFEGHNCETIGGYVIDCLGRIPKPGEKITLPINEQYTISVLDSTEKRIKKLKIDALT